MIKKWSIYKKSIIKYICEEKFDDLSFKYRIMFLYILYFL